MSAHSGAPVDGRSGASSSGEATGDPPADPSADPPAGPRSLRVLCVEDELVLRRTLLRLLEVLGHEAAGVESAEEGLATLRERDFDVVITDLRLPAMDGEELAAQIEQDHPKLRGRVILMSGFFHETQGPLNFLQKPFSAAQLSTALTRAAAGPVAP